MEYRLEHDTMGEVRVPADCYWGAQTQRSFENFRIGTEKMPPEVIRAFAVVKLAAARANAQLGVLDARRAGAIETACHETLDGSLDGNFPLAVWQTGSGTQTNMNVNEVIAHRANALLGETLVHPNDHVNCSQSSNDTFPTAMHVAARVALEEQVLPAVDRLLATLERLSAEYRDVVKIGRTHLQDAVPLTLGQEISGWSAMLDHDRIMLTQACGALRELALGGTAVGTGLNAPAAFGDLAAAEISALLGYSFESAPNKFHALTSKDQMVFAHGALKALAADLMKIANDVRWLASGPRCGIGELIIPANEPGSSIMPGKVNPTQCEAVTMVAVQVMGNDTAIGFAASQGNFQLNVFLPVTIYNFLQSARLLADVMDSFEANCVRGIRPNYDAIQAHLDASLMLVTALNPHIGYENAARIAKHAHATGQTLKTAAVELTRRWNLCAVITDGSAVLGLGDIGPEAGMPVMEGKCVLFKAFADVDAFPLCIRTQDVDEFVRTVYLLSGSFGGINLEDIAAPRCFEIERKLKELCDIPVFHDDQHGTAIITLAGLTNALRVVGKRLEDVKIVVSGAGAAAISISKLLLRAGARDVTLCDRKGAIYQGREGLNWIKTEMAEVTNLRRQAGMLADVVRDADVFIGVSQPGLLTGDMVRTMHRDAIVFACANPTPEIFPEEARAAGAAVVSTGRSDYPNQINNVLAFPGIFRGAFDVRASDINEPMKLAAAHALAALITPEELSADYIIPKAFDPRVGPAVAAAVAQAARESGVARI